MRLCSHCGKRIDAETIFSGSEHTEWGVGVPPYGAVAVQRNSHLLVRCRVLNDERETCLPALVD